MPFLSEVKAYYNTVHGIFISDKIYTLNVILEDLVISQRSSCFLLSLEEEVDLVEILSAIFSVETDLRIQMIWLDIVYNLVLYNSLTLCSNLFLLKNCSLFSGKIKLQLFTQKSRKRFYCLLYYFLELLNSNIDDGDTLLRNISDSLITNSIGERFIENIQYVLLVTRKIISNKFCTLTMNKELLDLISGFYPVGSNHYTSKDDNVEDASMDYSNPDELDTIYKQSLINLHIDILQTFECFKFDIITIIEVAYDLLQPNNELSKYSAIELLHLIITSKKFELSADQIISLSKALPSIIEQIPSFSNTTSIFCKNPITYFTQMMCNCVEKLAYLTSISNQLEVSNIDTHILKFLSLKNDGIEWWSTINSILFSYVISSQFDIDKYTSISFLNNSYIIMKEIIDKFVAVSKIDKLESIEQHFDVRSINVLMFYKKILFYYDERTHSLIEKFSLDIIHLIFDSNIHNVFKFKLLEFFNELPTNILIECITTSNIDRCFVIDLVVHLLGTNRNFIYQLITREKDYIFRCILNLDNDTYQHLVNKSFDDMNWVTLGFKPTSQTLEVFIEIYQIILLNKSYCEQLIIILNVLILSIDRCFLGSSLLTKFFILDVLAPENHKFPYALPLSEFICHQYERLNAIQIFVLLSFIDSNLLFKNDGFIKALEYFTIPFRSQLELVDILTFMDPLNTSISYNNQFIDFLYFANCTYPYNKEISCRIELIMTHFLKIFENSVESQISISFFVFIYSFINANIESNKQFFGEILQNFKNIINSILETNNFIVPIMKFILDVMKSIESYIFDVIPKSNVNTIFMIYFNNFISEFSILSLSFIEKYLSSCSFNFLNSFSDISNMIFKNLNIDMFFYACTKYFGFILDSKILNFDIHTIRNIIILSRIIFFKIMKYNLVVKVSSLLIYSDSYIHFLIELLDIYYCFPQNKLQVNKINNDIEENTSIVNANFEYVIIIQVIEVLDRIIHSFYRQSNIPHKQKLMETLERLKDHPKRIIRQSSMICLNTLNNI